MKQSIIILLFTLLTLNLYATQDVKTPSKEEKMIVLFVKTETCPWCIKMERETFKNRDAINKIKKLYEVKIIIKGNQLLPSFIHPKYYPTTYILSANGKKLIDELPGYMKTIDLVSYLEELYEVEMNPDEEEED